MEQDHVNKRQTLLGRWFPIVLYVANVILWIITATAAGAFDRLWLAILPLPALGLYLWRSRGTLV